MFSIISESRFPIRWLHHNAKIRFGVLAAWAGLMELHGKQCHGFGGLTMSFLSLVLPVVSLTVERISPKVIAFQSRC